jgi:predicted aspartyl protease
LISVLLVAGCATTQEACGPAQRQAEISVAVVRNLPLVAARVNGEPATLVLDTGAERTLFTASAVDRLRIGRDPQHVTIIHGLGSSAQSMDGRPAAFEIGGIALRPENVAVGDFALPSVGGAPPDGLLGASFLSRYDVDLDLPHRRATLYAARTCQAAVPAWSGPYVELPAERTAHSHILLPVDVDGRRLLALFDTGTQITVMGAAAAAADPQETAGPARLAPLTLQGAGTATETAQAHRFGEAQIGPESFAEPVFAVADLATVPGDMVLGMDYLARRRFWLSYASGRVFIASAKEP